MASMEKVSGDEVIPDIFLLCSLGKNSAEILIDENLTTTSGSAGGGKRRWSWAKAKAKQDIGRGEWRGGWVLLWSVLKY